MFREIIKHMRNAKKIKTSFIKTSSTAFYINKDLVKNNKIKKRGIVIKKQCK